MQSFPGMKIIKFLSSALIIFVFLNPSYSQDKQKSDKKIKISGTVLDSKNNPVSGARVMVDGETSGIQTDDRGSYKIRVTQNTKKLGISVVNVLSSEQEINGRKKIDFRLENYTAAQSPEPKSDSDIDIGYGTVKNKDRTSSSKTINGSENQYASYQNIYEMISGEVPGVSVSGRSIRIQGTTSINSSTEPLLVVDGIIVSTIDNILPRMVKSIEVLKGASAAIYGSRGANGVILITLVGKK